MDATALEALGAAGLKDTSLTCVHYAAGDTPGKALAYASLLPYVVLLFQASKVYCRRELHEAVVLLGLVGAEGAARTLKHLLRQPRPAATCAALGVCDSHGMPSSHACMMCAALTIWACMGAMLARKRQPLANALAAAEVAALAGGAAAVAASRVYLGYHTAPQVAAGAALGVACGLSCFWSLQAFGGLLKLWLRVPLVTALGFKDTWGVGDCLRMEQWLYGTRQQQPARKHQ